MIDSLRDWYRNIELFLTSKSLIQMQLGKEMAQQLLKGCGVLSSDSDRSPGQVSSNWKLILQLFSGLYEMGGLSPVSSANSQLVWYHLPSGREAED